MSRRHLFRYAPGFLILLVMLGWSLWLLQQRKSLVEYMVGQARTRPALPFCQWVPRSSPRLVALGFSQTRDNMWTNQKHAVLALRTGDRSPLFVDLGIVAVAGNGVKLSADGGKRQSLRREPLPGGGVVRLPLRARTRDGVHTVVINVRHPKFPKGAEQRWLGVAINKVRVCDDPAPAPP